MEGKVKGTIRKNRHIQYVTCCEWSCEAKRLVARMTECDHGIFEMRRRGIEQIGCDLSSSCAEIEGMRRGLHS